jgi:alkanesulfonate monooxygenase SsuD/methylene tetrahydromethanopterin reductase-like flavin-dependent oxidoreductase (luciferase family)
MRFGLFGSAQARRAGPDSDSSQGFREFIDNNVEAEALGYYSTFLVEHHFTGFGQVSASLSLLTWLGARTRHLRLGTAVLVLPWHNPALLAEQAGTLDLLSNGRFDFGIGKGYRWGEFHGFCVPMQEADERYRETVAFLRKAWTSEGRFSHHGKYWHYDDVVIEPAPVQKPHPPLWVGAASPNSIRFAAEQGYNLLLGQGGGPETVAEGVSIYRRAVEALGRTYDSSMVGLTRALHIAMNDSEREAALELRAKFMAQVEQLSLSPTGELPTLGRARKALTQAERHALTERDALIGRPDEIIRRIKRLQEGGVEYIMVIDFAARLDHLRMFAREVMPAFE